MDQSAKPVHRRDLVKGAAVAAAAVGASALAGPRTAIASSERAQAAQSASARAQVQGTSRALLSGFAYRHYWGLRKGQWKLTLNSASIRSTSRVFVSAMEGHMGAARYTVHNVVPFNGGVVVWVNIEWGAPIRLYLDYLVVS